MSKEKKTCDSVLQFPCFEHLTELQELQSSRERQLFVKLKGLRAKYRTPRSESGDRVYLDFLRSLRRYQDMNIRCLDCALSGCCADLAC
mmetsp:Transcript_7172/g.15500  ORF Transcript_7172/g.15500 Transcript_7172/m.15500 type:complete len:89 (-) Transcript_7172:371-637(-)